MCCFLSGIVCFVTLDLIFAILLISYVSVDSLESIHGFLHLSRYLCHHRMSPKLWIPEKVFPSYSYLEPCHNMRFYKKIFSFFLKAWNFSTRSMQVFCKGGEWLDPSKVNFTECWFQVKIFLKAEMLQLCILFLPAYSPQIFFNIKKKVWIGKHFNDGLGAHGSWEFLTISGGIFLIESFRVLESLGEFIWPLGSPWWGLNGLLSWFCSYGLFYRLTNS